jgi:hypothetical protein
MQCDLRPPSPRHFRPPRFFSGGKTRRVIGAGEKQTGEYWVHDSATGDLVGSIQAVPSCEGSEGLFADGAINENDGVVFVNGINCKVPSHSPFLPPIGAVIALIGLREGRPRRGGILSGPGALAVLDKIHSALLRLVVHEMEPELMIDIEKPAVLFSTVLFEVAALQVGLVGLEAQDQSAEAGLEILSR